nr:unnamed protein product [Spirometra erinaceieuropaei]
MPLSSIHKHEGNCQVCNNHRGICLLNIAGKIFARILLNRLKNHLEEEFLPESQCGFRRHRGTTDMIFVARQLRQKFQEMRTHLYFIFVDLMKAFDTVNREGLDNHVEIRLSRAILSDASPTAAPVTTTTAHKPGTPTDIKLTIVKASNVESVQTCPRCDRTSTSRISLVDHLRAHRTEAHGPVPRALILTPHIRPHCPHCTRTFTRRMDLLGYMRINESGTDRSRDTSSISSTFAMSRSTHTPPLSTPTTTGHTTLSTPFTSISVHILWPSASTISSSTAANLSETDTDTADSSCPHCPCTFTPRICQLPSQSPPVITLLITSSITPIILYTTPATETTTSSTAAAGEDTPDSPSTITPAPSPAVWTWPQRVHIATFTPRIGLDGHVRIHRSETGKSVPGTPTYTRRIRVSCPHRLRISGHCMNLFGHMNVHDDKIHTNIDALSTTYISDNSPTSSSASSPSSASS